MKQPWTSILAGVALLLGGCNLGGSSTGQGTVNLSVGISKPTAGAYTNQREVEVRIAATGGRVESAKLRYNGPSSGEIPLAPSGGVWRGTLPESLSSGTYTLKAEAQAGSSVKESDSVSFVFDKDQPQITVLAPTSPVTLSSTSLEVRVRAQDTHSGIKSVKLFADATLLEEKLGASGGEYIFTVKRDVLPEGLVALRVVAEDLAGNVQETLVSVTVDRALPTVVWKAPASGATVSGLVTLEVEATDNVGVAKVEFFAGSTKLGEATSAPYTFNWNTAGYPDGPVTLKARAVDAAGNATEATLTVTVANAPRISWLNPTPNQQVAGLVTLQVEVQALRSVERVEFYFGPDETQMSKIPGTPSQSGSTYTLDWNVLRVAPGDYLLKAKVVDAQGSEAEALIPVKVGSTFVITTPAEGEEVGPGAQKEIVAVTIGINGTLPPGVNVSKVEIYINGRYVEDALNATAGDGSQIFIYTWDTTQLAPGHDPTLSGDRVITARVYYTGGDTGGDTWTNGVRVSYQP